MGGCWIGQWRLKNNCCENGHSPPDLPVAVMVQFDCYSGPTLSDGSVPIYPLHRTWFASNNQYSRLQVPLKLAWAVTIHKSQGMTVDKAVINVGRKEFSSGLRVRHMCDLLFVPPFPFQRVANLMLLIHLHPHPHPLTGPAVEPAAGQISPP